MLPYTSSVETCRNRGTFMQPRRFQQRQRAAQIGLKDRLRRENAAVHVRFRGEMHDARPACVSSTSRLHQRRVADIAVHETVARVACDCRARFSRFPA